MKTLLCLLALSVTLHAQDRIRLFIQPPPATEFVDATSSGLANATEEMVKRLSGTGRMKDKWIELVSQLEQADIVIAVIDRGTKETGTSTTTLQPRGFLPPLSETKKDTSTYITIRLAVGDYTKDFTSGTSSWGDDMTNDLHEQLDKWVKANSATILAKRATK